MSILYIPFPVGTEVWDRNMRVGRICGGYEQFNSSYVVCQGSRGELWFALAEQVRKVTDDPITSRLSNTAR